MGDGEVTGSGDGRMRDFTDRRVWRAAMDLGERLYRLTWTFPRNETYGLAGQIQRASVSVPSIIAEGHARESLKEYLSFLSSARSSLAELRTQNAFAGRLGYLSEDEVQATQGEIVAPARQWMALRDALRTSAAGQP